ncbi:Optic atrophy 3 protein [Aphanomyces cochlioides]|nr:Optic atrophy 3 protein [Aphanomyces cochlioides]
MVAIPLFKVGGLLLRTLTKPVAKALKSRSKTQPWLNSICNSIGQRHHRVLLNIQMSMQGQIHSRTVQIKPLPADQAVEKGADFLGEVLIFSVALGVAAYEYDRSNKSSKEKERKANERDFQKQQEIDMRFRRLEHQMREMDDQLALFKAQLDAATATLIQFQEDRQHEKPPATSRWLW